MPPTALSDHHHWWLGRRALRVDPRPPCRGLHPLPASLRHLTVVSSSPVCGLHAPGGRSNSVAYRVAERKLSLGVSVGDGTESIRERRALIGGGKRGGALVAGDAPLGAAEEMAPGRCPASLPDAR